MISLPFKGHRCKNNIFSGRYRVDDVQQDSREDCYLATLHITDANLQDARPYYLVVENERGVDRHAINLRVEGMFAGLHSFFYYPYYCVSAFNFHFHKHIQHHLTFIHFTYFLISFNPFVVSLFHYICEYILYIYEPFKNICNNLPQLNNNHMMKYEDEKLY